MNEDKMERLSRFLDNDLTPEELKSFELELQSDKALRTMLALHLQLKAVAKEEQKKQIATMLDEALQTTPLHVQSFRPILWKVAASILLLVVAWWGIKTLITEQDVLAHSDGVKMYQVIMERERAALTVAGDGSIEKMRVELQQKPDPCNYKDLCYFVGVYELFQLHDYSKAIAYLRCTEAPANNGRHFREDVPFLLVIAYVVNGQYEPARQLVAQYELSQSLFPASVWEKIEVH